MDFAVWKRQYTVGVHELDNQHKQLLRVLNDLHGAITRGESNQEIEKLLNEFAKYGIEHFSTEEHYLDEFGYPDAKQHLVKHDALETLLSKFMEDHKNNVESFSLKKLRTLKERVEEHILIDDYAYAQHFKKMNRQLKKSEASHHL